MLFVVDHDVDAAVARVLRGAGHRCVTASQAGLATASDDEVSVFADNHGAVAVTHDKEFIQRRRENTFGKHVWLDCNDMDAASVVQRRLPEIVTRLDEREAMVIRVPKDGELTVYPTRWR